MDTNKEYILMCEKALEIQDYYRYVKLNLDNSFFYNREISELVLCHSERGNFAEYSATCDSDPNFSDDFSGQYYTWLPRQDQLQEMMYKNLSLIDFIGVNINISIFTKEQLESNKRFNSFEQLWLAFVMKEKYSKLWSEEKQDWISE